MLRLTCDAIGDAGGGSSGGGGSGGSSGGSGGAGGGDSGGHFDGNAVSLLVLMLGLTATGLILLRFELGQMPKTTHKPGEHALSNPTCGSILAVTTVCTPRELKNAWSI